MCCYPEHGIKTSPRTAKDSIQDLQNASLNISEAWTCIVQWKRLSVIIDPFCGAIWMPATSVPISISHFGYYCVLDIWYWGVVPRTGTFLFLRCAFKDGCRGVSGLTGVTGASNPMEVGFPIWRTPRSRVCRFPVRNRNHALAKRGRRVQFGNIVTFYFLVLPRVRGEGVRTVETVQSQCRAANLPASYSGGGKVIILHCHIFVREIIILLEIRYCFPWYSGPIRKLQK